MRGILTPAKKFADLTFVLTIIFACWNVWPPGSAPKISGLHLAVQLVMHVEIAFLYGLESLF